MRCACSENGKEQSCFGAFQRAPTDLPRFPGIKLHRIMMERATIDGKAVGLGYSAGWLLAGLTSSVHLEPAVSPQQSHHP